ncbi:Rpn family recombination-promoting nuclease/putative transposase [Moorella sp. ACPs]|uniref:Rpn family recombination-promoting nuclease/putative transposase n=1 Tax=Neomoorella carbonis TaxID=3062783 RepID=UPI00325208E2
MPVDHDRLFKELLTTFFREFIELFFPEAHALIDYSDTRFLTQEIITDITAGDKHYVDILAEVKIKGEDGCVLVHIEPQAYRQADFARRMFIYFSRLYEKHQKRVLPIAVFAHDSKAEETNRHEVEFPFLKVLQFEFYKVQLKRLPWRQYLGSNNPVAAALLSKMDYSPRERVQVKIEFLRLLTRMQLDPARMELITAFFESYLVLNAEEEKTLQEKLPEELQPEEVQRVMELTTSWHLKGRQQGRQEILLRQLRKRLGTISSEVEVKIKTLSVEQLDDLAEKILDITSEDELLKVLDIKH